MPDYSNDPQLRGIVGRMVDAGEPEENIGKVIAEYTKEKSDMESKGFHQDTSKEPDTYWGGFRKGLGDYVRNVGQGIADEVPAVPLNLVKSVGSVIGAVPAAVGGIVDAMQNPEQATQNVKDAITGIPGKVKDFVTGEINKGVTDPYGYGKDLANAGGQAALGAALGEAPAALGKAGVLTGKALETVGKTGNFAMRIVGSHQLLSGNPAGAILMVGPEVLKGVGKRLQLANEEPIPPEADVNPYETKFNESLDQRASAMSPQEQLINWDKLVDEAHRDATNQLGAKAEGLAKEAQRAVKAEVSSRKASLQQAIKDAKAAQTPNPFADKVVDMNTLNGGPDIPSQPVPSHEVPPANDIYERNKAIFKGAPTPPDDVTTVDALRGGPEVGARPTQVNVMPNTPDVFERNRAAFRVAPSHGNGAATSGDDLAAELMKRFPGINPNAAAAATATSRLPVQPPSEPMSAPAASPMSYAAAVKERNRLEALPESLPSNPNHAAWQQQHNVVDDLITAVENSRSRPVSNGPIRVANVPINQVPATRTSRDLSATEGLSANDMKVLGLNPNVKVTSIRPDQVEKILQYRRERGMNYRDLATLEARLKALLASGNQ